MYEQRRPDDRVPPDPTEARGKKKKETGKVQHTGVDFYGASMLQERQVPGEARRSETQMEVFTHQESTQGGHQAQSTWLMRSSHLEKKGHTTQHEKVS